MKFSITGVAKVRDVVEATNAAEAEAAFRAKYPAFIDKESKIISTEIIEEAL